jgi:hypothetical protein
LDQRKHLQHWARTHVANEVFAVRHGLLEMTDAKWVRSQDALDLATFHLGLCPNPDCSPPPVIRLARENQISRHTSEHPDCATWFKPSTVTGYSKLIDLGYKPWLFKLSDIGSRSIGSRRRSRRR